MISSSKISGAMGRLTGALLMIPFCLLSMTALASPEQPSSLVEAEGYTNTAAAWFAKAEKLAAQKQWREALVLLSKAQALGPDAELSRKISDLRSQGAERLLQQANVQLKQRQLYKAYLSMMAGVEFFPEFLSKGNAADIRQRLLTEILAKSKEYETSGLLGNALHWQELAIKLGGTDRSSSERLQGIKDRLRQRVVKKVAVMDVSPPSNSMDAGKLVTDSLLSYMSKNASNDLRIVDRDALGAMIREIKADKSGQYDIESARKNGRLKGSDIFISVSVTQYTVEMSAEESTKMVNVSVGKKSMSNPAYLSWRQRNPSPGERELAMAPPSMVEEDIRETVRYKVGAYKKTANVALFLSMIDVESGKMLLSKTTKCSREAQDNFSEGVESANIPFDPLQLPPDAEILEKAVEEGVAELGQLALSHLQNLQSAYLNSAGQLGRKGQHEAAVERYTDAIVSEEVKNVQSQVTEQARREIDLQLQLADSR